MKVKGSRGVSTEERQRQEELVFHLSKNGLDNAMLSIWGLQKHQPLIYLRALELLWTVIHVLMLYLGLFIHSTTIY